MDLPFDVHRLNEKRAGVGAHAALPQKHEFHTTSAPTNMLIQRRRQDGSITNAKHRKIHNVNFYEITKGLRRGGLASTCGFAHARNGRG